LVLYGEGSVWFHKLQIFREREEERMYRQEPSAEDLEIHKSLVLRLVADGEHLLQLIRQSAGLIQNPEQIKTEDLAAAVESLRDTYRGWHEPLSANRRADILKGVFRDVA